MVLIEHLRVFILRLHSFYNLKIADFVLQINFKINFINFNFLIVKFILLTLTFSKFLVLLKLS